MTPRDRRYLLLTCCLGSALVNAVINGGIGWGITSRTPLFPVWHIPGVVADLAGTAFGVTFGTCLGMAFQIRRDLRAGRVGHFEASAVSPGVASLVARFPVGIFRRSMGLGAVSIPVFTLPVVLGLVIYGGGALDRVPFVVLKSSFAAVQAAMVTPLIALAALGDAAKSRAATTVAPGVP